MNPASSSSRYILLPEGSVAPTGPASELLGQLPRARSVAEPEPAALDVAEGREVKIVDTADPEGARLVEADPKVADLVNRGDSPLRMVPVVEFAPPNPRLRAYGNSSGAAPEAAPPAPASVEITCSDEATGAAVGGAHIVAFTNFELRVGGEGTTDATGKATVKLRSTTIERLYVYPPTGGRDAHWGCFRAAVDGSAPVAVSLTPVDLGYVDAVRHYYGKTKFNSDLGVQVGVIDTGIGPHSDLNVVSGINTVEGEPLDDYADLRGHGTHVAGLIGSDGAPPSGLRGLAPGVQLHAFRVFPKGKKGADNWSILKAMIFAARNGCDIVNLSLGGGPHDPVVEEAISYLRNTGTLVVIAVGNDERFPATFPSAYPQATAVTAMGRQGTFPPGSLEESNIPESPFGGDPNEFLADFSNVGQEVTVTGPGVGDLSTLPGNRFGPLSGTSMSAPVITGAVACLLSQSPSVFGMERGAERSQAIENLLTGSCRPLGFGKIYEGKGMPDPTMI